jgi:hypothetical protein
MMAPLVMQWSQAIKRQNPTTIQIILPMMTPMVMQWMETIQQQDPAMAQVMLATWLDEQPRKADVVPDLRALLFSLMHSSFQLFNISFELNIITKVADINGVLQRTGFGIPLILSTARLFLRSIESSHRNNTRRHARTLRYLPRSDQSCNSRRAACACGGEGNWT